MIVEDPEHHELDALTAAVPSFAGLRILEIGAGDGRLTRHYADAAASIIAIDPDADAIAELRANLRRVDARAVGVEDLRLPDNSVDLLVFAWSL